MIPKIVSTKDLRLYNDQKERLDALGDVTYYDNIPSSTDEWYERCKDADIILTGTYGLKSDRVYDLKNVFISLPFVGVEFLDKNRLKEKNITVSNSPGCNKEAVVEWMLGMMIMFYRKLSKLNRTISLDKDDILKEGVGLYNKNISILGTGNIGKHLGNICNALGMKVNYFKRGDDLIESVRNADIVVNCLNSNCQTIIYGIEIFSFHGKSEACLFQFLDLEFMI